MALHHAQIEKLSQKWPTGSLAQWPACKQKAKTGASITWDAFSVGSETVGTSCVVKALRLRRREDLARESRASIVWTDEDEGFQEVGLQTGHGGAGGRITVETRLPPSVPMGSQSFRRLSMYSLPGTPRIMRDRGKGKAVEKPTFLGVKGPGEEVTKMSGPDPWNL